MEKWWPIHNVIVSASIPTIFRQDVRKQDAREGAGILGGLMDVPRADMLVSVLQRTSMFWASRDDQGGPETNGRAAGRRRHYGHRDQEQWRVHG